MNIYLMLARGLLFIFIFVQVGCAGGAKDEETERKMDLVLLIVSNDYCELSYSFEDPNVSVAVLRKSISTLTDLRHLITDPTRVDIAIAFKKVELAGALYAAGLQSEAINQVESALSLLNSQTGSLKSYNRAELMNWLINSYSESTPKWAATSIERIRNEGKP